MKLGSVFAHAVVRKIGFGIGALILAAALSFVGVGEAKAATFAEAMQNCNAMNYNMGCSDNGPKHCEYGYALPNGSGQICGKASYCGGNNTCQAYSYAFTPCVGVETYDVVTHMCKDMAAACKARNDDAPKNNSAFFTGNQCIDGCVYGANGTAGGKSSTNGALTIAYGEMGFTGATCSTPNPTPKPDTTKDNKQQCTPSGTGDTFCVKSNGDHCYSASTGRMICWKPGETGTKTDGDVLQKRQPGPPPVTPPPPPPGDSLKPDDASKNMSTSTTTNDNRNMSTTTNNFFTNSGADGGPVNQGEPADGSGSGEGEGDTPGTASGGEGCEAPPVCSGGDAVGCATLQQVWRTRCAEGRNKIEGGGECSADGHPQFVCHGDQVECKQALLLAEEFCAAQKADENGDGQPDWTKPGSGVDMTEGEGEDPEGMGEGPKQVPFGANFDTTGFLTPSSCPQMGSFTFWGRTFDLDNMGVFSLCDFTQMVHAIFLLLGAFVAFKIVGGVNT